MGLLEKIKNNKVYTIAEMSGNHAKDFNHALEIVHAAKESGADCIKIQTYTPDTLTIKCDNDCFKMHGGLWDGEILYDLYGKAYTPWEWHYSIQEEAKKVGIDFFSTPFDTTAVDFLEEMKVEMYKIASFELPDLQLLKYVASKGKPIILSCGLGSIEDIQDAIDVINSQGNKDIVLLKCTSEYPADFKDMNLATIVDMKDRFGYPVGFSDHSLGHAAAVAAVTLGARVVEKHFCVSRKIKNPDSEFSMEPQEFKLMVEAVNDAVSSVGTINYEPSEKEKKSYIQRRSLFIIKDMKKGDVFTEENLKTIRPGFGMKPKFINDVLGKCATIDIKYGTPLSRDLFE
jgi:pseudaminic acid synthase